jgi:phosphatidate cytidylyltransferase
MHARKVAAALAMSVFGGGVLVADYAVGCDICFHALLVVLTVRGLSEFYDMAESSRTGPFRGFGAFSAVMLILLHWAATPGTLEWFGAPAPVREVVAAGEIVLFGMVVAVLGSLWLQATKRDNDRTFEAISSTLFGILYTWFLASFLVKLRHLGAGGVLGGQDWNSTGTGLLVSCVAVSKLADVGGYLFGRKFGRHKMIPRISPNKSYEGLLAGLALSVGTALLLTRLGLLPLGGMAAAALFGVAVGGMGTLGDLAESLLKRGAGRKDTGDLVPGFGGVLDIVDSLLLSAPVAYFLALVLLRTA